jgi:hypothetical protein
MSLKKVIIFGSIVTAICVGVLVYLYLFKNNKQTNIDDTKITDQIQPLPTPTIPAGETISINTGGGDVMVNNFFKNPQMVIESSVYLTENKNYSLIYFNDSKYFLIALYARNAEDANTYRKLAEQDLLSKLGIGPETLCKLKVSAQIPYSYNSELSQDYHLSFCPDGLEIPGAQTTISNENLR